MTSGANNSGHTEMRAPSLGTPANQGRRRRGAPMGRWSTVLPGPANQRRLPWRNISQRSVLAELQF